MARYIDADMLKKELRKLIDKTDCNIAIMPDVFEAAENQPTADVKKVVHGEWKNNWVSTDEDLNGYYDDDFQCSECFEVSEGPTDFCPNCGADMRDIK